MEEGPEPQEWVERSVEHQHHGHEESHGADANRRSTMLSAITAAVLAVFAAFGSLLSGHEANQAILHLNRANDEWAHYQSQSTKGHVYEVGKEVIRSLMQGPDAQARVQPALERFDSQIQKYDNEKSKLQEKARALGNESDLAFDKHHWFALGIVAFQIGIVLASISIMVRYRTLWILSLFAGLVGIGFLTRGLFASPENIAKKPVAVLAPIERPPAEGAIVQARTAAEFARGQTRAVG
jgi:hypothetical protein